MFTFWGEVEVQCEGGLGNRGSLLGSHEAPFPLLRVSWVFSCTTSRV